MCPAFADPYSENQGSQQGTLLSLGWVVSLLAAATALTAERSELFAPALSVPTTVSAWLVQPARVGCQGTTGNQRCQLDLTSSALQVSRSRHQPLPISCCCDAKKVQGG